MREEAEEESGQPTATMPRLEKGKDFGMILLLIHTLITLLATTNTQAEGEYTRSSSRMPSFPLPIEVAEEEEKEMQGEVVWGEDDWDDENESEEEEDDDEEDDDGE